MRIAAGAVLAMSLLGCSSTAEDGSQAGPASSEAATAAPEGSRSVEPDSLAEATGTAEPTPTAIAAPTVERRLGCSDLDVDFSSESLQSSNFTIGGPAGGEVVSADCLWATEPDLTAEEAREMPGTVSALALTASDMDFSELKGTTLEQAGQVSQIDDGPDGLSFVATGEDFVRAEVMLPSDGGYVDCTWTQAETTDEYVATVKSLCLDFRELVSQARTEAYAARSDSSG